MTGADSGLIVLATHTRFVPPTRMLDVLGEAAGPADRAARHGTLPGGHLLRDPQSPRTRQFLSAVLEAH